MKEQLYKIIQKEEKRDTLILLKDTNKDGKQINGGEIKSMTIRN